MVHFHLVPDLRPWKSRENIQFRFLAKESLRSWVLSAYWWDQNLKCLAVCFTGFICIVKDIKISPFTWKTLHLKENQTNKTCEPMFPIGFSECNILYPTSLLMRDNLNFMFLIIQKMNFKFTLPIFLTDVSSGIKLITKCLCCLTVGNFRLQKEIGFEAIQ